MDSPLRRAIVNALPEGTTYGYNGTADERTWMHVIDSEGAVAPHITRQVLNTALAALDRPPLDA